MSSAATSRRAGAVMVELLVAWRLLRAGQRQGFITLIAWISLAGIAIGVAVLIITMSVMNGFRADLYARILGLNGHVVVNAADGPIKDYKATIARLGAVKGIASITPVVEGEVMAINEGQAQGALVRGIAPDDLAARSNLVNGIVSGRLQDFDSGGLILGERLRRQLALNPGQVVTLLSPRGGGDQPIEPVTADFDVAASFSVHMVEIDSSYIFMPLAQAQKFFDLQPNQATTLDIMVTDTDAASDVARQVAALLGSGYKVSDWRQRNAAFVGALQVERTVMFVILSLIVLVAALNILASFSMLVRTKVRSIAILRSMGVTRAGILRIFLMAGGLVGLIGTAVGALVGLLFCLRIDTIHAIAAALGGPGGGGLADFFARMPADVDWGEVASVLAVALGLSCAAAAYVAIRAAALEPVEALRYE